MASVDAVDTFAGYVDSWAENRHVGGSGGGIDESDGAGAGDDLDETLAGSFRFFFRCPQNPRNSRVNYLHPAPVPGRPAQPGLHDG